MTSTRFNGTDAVHSSPTRSPFRPLLGSFDEHAAVSYSASFASTTTSIPRVYDPSNNRVEVMERVLFHLHSRVCDFSLVNTSTRTRKLVEHVLLVAAICCFGALILLHRTFVIQTSGTDHPNNNDTALCLYDLPGGFDPSAADITHLVILPPPPSTSGSFSNSLFQQSQVVWKGRNCIGDGADSCTWKDAGESKDTLLLSWLSEQEQNGSLPVYYSYSTTKAYLMLPPKHRLVEEHLSIQYVLISPSESRCFGEPFIQFLIWKCFIGPDTILLNWIQSFHSYPRLSKVDSNSDAANTEGYVYNPRTNQILDLPIHEAYNNQQESSNSKKWHHRLPTLMSKVGVLAKTSFLFFFCTTLVSFTLRETQERMLDFTRELSRRFHQSLPVSDLITTHLIQNLVFVPIMVGMMFFLIEFYSGDKFLAFSVSSIVWCVESFSVLSLRSTQGLLYFPKFFFLLFLLFHVYECAFKKTGFVHTALTVVWCFMFHSMVFFWHRFELPAVALGHVTVHRPRMVTHTINSESDQLLEQRWQEHNFRSPERRSILADSTQATPRVGNLPPHPNNTSLPLPQTIMPTGSTASTSSIVPGGMGGTSNTAASQPSFSTTSSRNMGLFRHNHDDDNSTGSMLYFMGGEVVVHRGIPASAVSGILASETATMSREESNMSLPSVASDAVGANGNGRLALGLDVSESRRSYEDEDESDDEFANLPITTSMDTVPSSNTTPDPTSKNPTNGHQRDSTVRNGVLMDHYAHESGGLQAILESSLTPRHHNTHCDQDGPRPSEIAMDPCTRFSGNSQRNQSYQRTPPDVSGSAEW
ncbi:membralin family protein [Nitzschia inconspicua]|uniref:Membralin family protein n=1 Tax=Nitzschia inconspicua TaxID=303405 RepID=A0A9K3PB98_9STRA|nr:membralin family protein [Nitzschia inconspicua]